MAKQRRGRSVLHERAEQSGVLAAVVLGSRERLNLRQEELAELANCSPRFVHALETGKPTVQLDKVLDVLDVLGLRLEVAEGRAAEVTVSAGLREGLGLDPTEVGHG